LSWIIWEGLITGLDFNHQVNHGISPDLTKQFSLIEYECGKEIFKKSTREISLNALERFGTKCKTSEEM